MPFLNHHLDFSDHPLDLVGLLTKPATKAEDDQKFGRSADHKATLAKWTTLTT